MLTVFLRKICILGIAEYFLIVLFQISEIKKDEIRFKKYIFLLDMFLIVGGEGSSNRNASRDESVEAGEKTPQSCYNCLRQTAQRNSVMLSTACRRHVHSAENEFRSQEYRSAINQIREISLMQ